MQLWNVANPAHPQPLGHPLTGAGSFGVSLDCIQPCWSHARHRRCQRHDPAMEYENPAQPRPVKQVRPGLTEAIPLPQWRSVPMAACWPASTILVISNVERGRSPGSVPIGVATDSRQRLLQRRQSISYSPDGRTLTLLMGDGEIERWDITHVAIPKRLGPLPTVTTGVFSSLAFSRQGTLATGDDNGTIQLWNDAGTAHPKPDGQPIGSGSGITAIAFGPDGTLASSTSAGTILLWHLRVGDAIKRICATARGNLTPQNWHHYIPQLPYQSPCVH